MANVLLDGKIVGSKEIDPTKHRFIGTFRQPEPPTTTAAYYQCNCGHMLGYVHEMLQHWQMGHFDIPQYITIE